MLIDAIVIIFQSLVNRWRGDGSLVFGKKVKLLKQLACQIAPAFCLFNAGVVWWLIPPAVILGTLGIAVGHGKFYTLTRGPYPLREDNWPAAISRLFKLEERTWIYEAVALAVTGLCFTLPYAIAAATTSKLACIAIIVAGILKVLGYQIGLLIMKERDHIRIAEFSAGAIFGVGFATILRGWP